MSDLISREAAIEWFTRKENEFAEKHPTGMRLKFAEGIARALANIPAVDAVSRGLFEQIKWERDIAMEQLAEHGIAFGAKATAVDAVEVVRCKDCKWGVESDFYKSYKCTIDAEYDENVGEYIGFVEWHRADFYCAYGNRREENG